MAQHLCGEWQTCRQQAAVQPVQTHQHVDKINFILVHVLITCMTLDLDPAPVPLLLQELNCAQLRSLANRAALQLGQKA